MGAAELEIDYHPDTKVAGKTFKEKKKRFTAVNCQLLHQKFFSAHRQESQTSQKQIIQELRPADGLV